MVVEVRGSSQGSNTAKGKSLEAKLHSIIKNNPGLIREIVSPDYQKKK